MADESKTYLINIKSNLDEYAELARKADKAVKDFTEQNKELLASGDKTSVAYIKASAELKVLQKNRTDANKAVETATRVNLAEEGSYQKLYQAWKNAEVQLKLLEKTMVRNKDGTFELTKEYIEQFNTVEKMKKGLGSFGRQVNDNRLNVGNYTDSIKTAVGEMGMLPGAAGQAVGSINRMGMAFKALALNPLMLILGAIVGIIAALGKAFKNSQPLMDAFHKVSAALGATIKVLIDRLSNFVEFIGSIFNKELRESRREAKALNDELIGIEDTMSRREKREIRRANKKGLFEEIKEEATAAYELTAAEQKLEDAEIAFIQRRAELKRQIQENINSSKDENLTNAEKLKLMDEAIFMQEELTAKEVEFAKERARISDERTKQGNSTRAELRENEEAQSAATEAEAAGLKAQKKILSERFTLINKLTSEEKKALADRQKIAEEELKLAEKKMEASKKELTAEIEAYKKSLTERAEADKKALEEKKQRLIEQAEWERQQQLINQENILAIRELNNENEFSIQRERLRMQQEEEIRMAEGGIQQINLINEKYRLAQLVLVQQENDAKLAIYGSFASALAQLFGENTKIGRVAAVTATVINTYRGAMAAFAETPGGIIIKSLAAAAAVATGIASVKKILETKSGLPGDSGGGSAPTAISASAPAQRMFAKPTGSTVLTQPVLSQAQVNALPSANPATAEEIAAAIAKIPAPVVTVEDINAKTESVRKVEVRGTI